MLIGLCRQPGIDLYNVLSKKRQGMDKATMEGLRELSKMYLKTAEQCDTESWTKEAAPEPAVPQRQRVTFDDNVTVIPADSVPRRAAREIANLDPTTVVGNNGSPARNTRAKFAVAAAALAAVMIDGQADAHQWEHRKHSPMAHKLELNEVAHAVLEGDKMLNYRQLIQHPAIGEQWRHSSSNEFGRLAQGIGGRIKGTDTMRFIPKH